jgi:cytochrome b involved in lipid metabolism
MGSDQNITNSRDQHETLASVPSVSTPQDSEATKGLPRKVFTGTGYSGFDWLRLDIPPPKALRRFTIDEVQQHASADDCWIVLQGKVYDITPYIPFHPGGKYQILRAKGKDATELFMKTHPWVNPEPLLRKCWIGFLIR